MKNKILKTEILKTINIKDIDLSFQPIKTHNGLLFKRLVTSIKKYGMLNSVYLLKLPNYKKYFVLDGFIRIRAMQKLKRKMIKAIVTYYPITEKLL